MKAYCHTTVIMTSDEITFIKGKIYDFKLPLLDNGVYVIHLINEQGRFHGFGEKTNDEFNSMFNNHFYDITNQKKREKIINELID